MKHRAVFFDRDDTLMVNVPYLGDPNLFGLSMVHTRSISRTSSAQTPSIDLHGNRHGQLAHHDRQLPSATQQHFVVA